MPTPDPTVPPSADRDAVVVTSGTPPIRVISPFLAPIMRIARVDHVGDSPPTVSLVGIDPATHRAAIVSWVFDDGMLGEFDEVAIDTFDYEQQRTVDSFHRAYGRSSDFPRTRPFVVGNARGYEAAAVASLAAMPAGDSMPSLLGLPTADGRHVLLRTDMPGAGSQPALVLHALDGSSRRVIEASFPYYTAPAVPFEWPSVSPSGARVIVDCPHAEGFAAGPCIVETATGARTPLPIAGDWRASILVSEALAYVTVGEGAESCLYQARLGATPSASKLRCAPGSSVALVTEATRATAFVIRENDERLTVEWFRTADGSVLARWRMPPPSWTPTREIRAVLSGPRLVLGGDLGSLAVLDVRTGNFTQLSTEQLGGRIFSLATRVTDGHEHVYAVTNPLGAEDVFPGRDCRLVELDLSAR